MVQGNNTFSPSCIASHLLSKAQCCCSRVVLRLQNGIFAGFAGCSCHGSVKNVCNCIRRSMQSTCRVRLWACEQHSTMTDDVRWHPEIQLPSSVIQLCFIPFHWVIHFKLVIHLTVMLPYLQTERKQHLRIGSSLLELVLPSSLSAALWIPEVPECLIPGPLRTNLIYLFV